MQDIPVTLIQTYIVLAGWLLFFLATTIGNHQQRNAASPPPSLAQTAVVRLTMPHVQPPCDQGTLDSFLGLKRKRQTTITGFLRRGQDALIANFDPKCNSNDNESIPGKVDKSFTALSSSSSIKAEQVKSQENMDRNPYCTASRKRSRHFQHPDPVLSTMDPNEDLSYLGKRMAKAFQQQVDGRTIPIIHYGTISSVTRDHDAEGRLWLVQYDDKDEEEMDRKEIISSLALYKIFQPYDSKAEQNIINHKKRRNYDGLEAHMSPKQKRIRYVEDLARQLESKM